MRSIGNSCPHAGHFVSLNSCDLTLSFLSLIVRIAMLRLSRRSFSFLRRLTLYSYVALFLAFSALISSFVLFTLPILRRRFFLPSSCLAFHSFLLAISSSIMAFTFSIIFFFSSMIGFMASDLSSMLASHLDISLVSIFIIANIATKSVSL